MCQYKFPVADMQVTILKNIGSVSSKFQIPRVGSHWHLFSEVLYSFQEVWRVQPVVASAEDKSSHLLQSEPERMPSGVWSLAPSVPRRCLPTQLAVEIPCWISSAERSYID